MFLTHLSIITLVLVYYSGIPGASQTKIRTLCPIPDLFRTIFGTMVRIRTKSGIPDLIGPTEKVFWIFGFCKSPPPFRYSPDVFYGSPYPIKCRSQFQFTPN